jgi:hypothetical protein
VTTPYITVSRLGLAALCYAILPSIAIAAGPPAFDVVVSSGDSITSLNTNGTTRLLMQGGEVASIYMREQSYAELAGGHVSHLHLYDSVSVLISEGEISHVALNANAQANVAGGDISHFRAHETARASLTGGTIGFVSAYEDSQIDIYSGGMFGTITADGDGPSTPPSAGRSVVNQYGGTAGGIVARDGGVANLYGGSLSSINSDQNGVLNVFGGSFRWANLSPDSVTNVYGRDFDFQLMGYVHGTPNYRWTGVLRDGTPLDAELRQFTGAVLNLITVPEPTGLAMATPALAALGTLIGRRRVAWPRRLRSRDSAERSFDVAMTRQRA